MAIDKASLPDDGGEFYNRLIFARSPYLLQHAENPVDWYEWGEVAFAKARNENIPIMLSIGYATCHWCHVMAHESFEDSEVASLLSRHFVCIKVDREERPDIDDFYMAAAQALTGSGGWPLNVFITPDKRPFMAITYLPKRGRDGMSGLMELLANIATLWRQSPDKIDSNCMAIMEAIENSRATLSYKSKPDLANLADASLQQLTKIYDRRNGGFGNAPKFPMPIYLSWLLAENDAAARDMALYTLRKMRSGGIWDQLGGGVHRYSVDKLWLAPHFEKMLYDQAMMVRVATEAFLVSGEDFYQEMADNILSFVMLELASPEGAFYAALDADSEGEEGTFYLWKMDEISACLGSDAKLFCLYYAVSAEGNFEGRTILATRTPLDKFCLEQNLEIFAVKNTLERSRARLLENRKTRIHPLRDEKIITSWNGLMISAMATAGITFENQAYIAGASRSASFILDNLRRPDGRILRSYLLGASPVPAFLEDYAFFALGLLDLYEATLEQIWLKEAQVLADELLRLFHNPESGEFCLIGYDAEQMPGRAASDHDGVTPSALASTARLFYRLAWIDDRPEFCDAARKAVAEAVAPMQRSPLGHLGALRVMMQLEMEPVIATFSGDCNIPELHALNVAMHRQNVNNLIIRYRHTTSPPTLSICGNGVCYPPVLTVSDLELLLLQSGLTGSRQIKLQNCDLPATSSM